MKCASCGAEIAPGAVRCEFCDSVCAPVESLARANVFEQVKRSPQFARKDNPSRRSTLAGYPVLAVAGPVGFFILFIGVALFMATQAGSHGAPTIFVLFPMIFVAVGVFAAFHVIRKYMRFQDAPIMARAAVIAGKRLSVTGGSGDSNASTFYFITAEFDDGSREEYAVLKSGLYGRVSEGDAGVIFTRADSVLDFDRVTGGVAGGHAS
ncbi:MAG: DUF2500 family protein [Pirellulales bacterium]|nr:DUF2500 family protein [Pirellulales bacterium]